MFKNEGLVIYVMFSVVRLELNRCILSYIIGKFVTRSEHYLPSNDHIPTPKYIDEDLLAICYTSPQVQS